jgi:hypothetical protein
MGTWNHDIKVAQEEKEKKIWGMLSELDGNNGGGIGDEAVKQVDGEKKEREKVNARDESRERKRERLVGVQLRRWA